MGSVLRSVGASQGNIWTVAPFIPVKMGSKNTKSAKNQKAPNRCCWNFQDFLDRVPGAQISWSGKRRIFWPIPSLRHGVQRNVIVSFGPPEIIFLSLTFCPNNLRAENQFSAPFPGKRAETRRKIILRTFSRKKGGELIFRQGGGRKAEGGFYPRPFFFPLFTTECLQICFQSSSVTKTSI